MSTNARSVMKPYTDQLLQTAIIIFAINALCRLCWSIKNAHYAEQKSLKRQRINSFKKNLFYKCKVVISFVVKNNLRG
jgi:hypothetical protein